MLNYQGSYKGPSIVHLSNNANNPLFHTGIWTMVVDLRIVILAVAIFAVAAEEPEKDKEVGTVIGWSLSTRLVYKFSSLMIFYFYFQA